ncbi:hypothetical protein ACH5RR_032350 [Cinchona calisaya]|uniref:Uncharacterized protein n=1 Tax=Cinchona calisaya TaxID=153742 RepID=A0ABD2YHW4_9GENT
MASAYNRLQPRLEELRRSIEQQHQHLVITNVHSNSMDSHGIGNNKRRIKGFGTWSSMADSTSSMVWWRHSQSMSCTGGLVAERREEEIFLYGLPHFPFPPFSLSA